MVTRTKNDTLREGIYAAIFSRCKRILVGFGILSLLSVNSPAKAQLGDLRYSRAPVPGIADVSRIKISVNSGSAQSIMTRQNILDILRPRLESIGYQVMSASNASFDGLNLQVDCAAIQDKAKRVSDVRQSGQQLIAERVGPPCRLAYSYHSNVIPWRQVDRLVYSESVATMERISQSRQFLKAQECVEQFLRLYDFPILVAAEWGHVDRLLNVLKQPGTAISRQRLIIKLLGETRAARAFPILVDKLRDVSIADEAAQALGFFGSRGQVHLLPLVQRRSNLNLQIAAAKGLGRIAAATGDSQHVPLYLKMIADASLDLRVRTQLVWALGKAPDMRALPTLLQLEHEIWTHYSRSPDFKEFREAVDWSLRQVKQGGHGDDY